MQAYTYVKTMFVGKELNARWSEAVAPSQTIANMFANYREALIVVYNVLSQEQLAYPLTALLAGSYVGTQSISQFLVSNDNITLATIPVPTIDPKLVRYADAHRSGYSVQAVKMGYADNAPLLPEQRTDARLTRDGIIYENFTRNCLVSINGFFHMDSVTANGIYIKDGKKSVDVCGFTKVGIYNFEKVGQLTKIALGDCTIYPTAPSNPLKNRFTVDVGQNASNKYAIFFIGGYMVPVGGKTVSQIGDSTFTIAFDDFDWINKFFEMKRFLNVESLGLITPDNNEDAYFRADLDSNLTIERLLQMPQSFVALVDTPSFFIEKAPLPISRLPGQYRSYGNISNLPLQLGYGRMAEYWVKKDFTTDGLNGLFVADNFKHMWNFNLTDPSSPITIDTTRPAGRRSAIADAWFLNMGRDF